MTRHTVNSSTGEIIEIAITDEWIKSWRHNEILLSLSALSIISDDIDSATLTAQLVTALLLDDSQEDVLQTRTFRLQIGDIEQEITLDANGAWSDTITSVVIGSYSISALDMTSNQLMLEVV
jgi:hypothetical protein